MSNILDKPTMLEQRAIDVLEQLRKESGLDSVNRVYGVVASEVWGEHRDDKYTKARNSLASTAYSPQWLQRKRIKRDAYLMDDGPNLYLDHAGCYEDRETNERVIINEPYDLSYENACRLVDVCREYGLRFDIDSRQSVWFPGATITIKIRKEEAA